MNKNANKKATHVSPRIVLRRWVEAFNSADIDKIATFYDIDAVNHQVVQEPVTGRSSPGLPGASNVTGLPGASNVI